MAKMNKYWGMVAVGALTAAAAGFVAAAFMKKKVVTDGPDFEDEFDEDFDTLEKPDDEEKETHEDFASWEPSAENEDKEETDEQKGSGEENDAASKEAEEETATEEPAEETEEKEDDAEKND